MALCDVKKFSVILLALFLVAPPVISNVVYVRPNNSTSCPGQPCHTLMEYAADVELLPSNTEAIFGIGDHLLDTTLRFGYSNITFTGNMAKILFYPRAYIVVTGIENITLNLLQCELYEQISQYSFIFLNNANSIEIANISFKEFNYERLYIMTLSIISSLNSNVKFSNCSFLDIINIGGILEARNSEIDFSGNNFTNNSAFFSSSHGLLHMISSNVTFNDNIFYQNAKKMLRSIILIQFSSIQFSGITMFKENGRCIRSIQSTVQIDGIAVFENNTLSHVIEAATNSLLEMKGNVTFISNKNNYVILLHSQTQMNSTGEIFFYNNNINVSSVISVSNSDMYLSGITNFESNSAAIKATNSQLELNGKVTFNNHDQQVIRLARESSMNCFGEVTFSNNIITGSSVVSADMSNLSFSGMTMFKENGWCIYSIQSTVQIDGIAVFENNTHVIEAVANSQLKMKGNVTFINNKNYYVVHSRTQMNSTGEKENGWCIRSIQSTVQIDGIAVFENNTHVIEASTNSQLEMKGNVTFINNKNYYVILLRSRTQMNSTGEIFFYNNNINVSSVISVSNSDMYLSGITNFESNSGAIEATTFSQLELNGKVTFSNHDQQVIHLTSESSMNCFGEVTFSNNIITGSSVVSAHMSNLSFSGIMNFDSNSALNANGGAIHALESDVVLEGTMNFFNNEAQGGYGGAVFVNRSTLHIDGIISFENNTARKDLNINTNGGAIYSFDSDVTLKGSIDFLNNWAEEGFGGAIFAFSSTLQTEGDCMFADNNAKSLGGVIFVVDSDIQLSGNIQFEKNKALSGGAIAFDNSTLTLLGPVTVDFIENEAEDAGGALFLLDQDSITLCDKKLSYFSTEECFFRLLNFNETDQNIQLNFRGNIAENGGTVLYGGSLDECTVDISGTSKKGFEAFEDISDITYPNNNDSSSDITSNPKEMCFCINGTTPDCSLIYPEENITTVRGRHFNLSVVLVGQGNKPVASTLRAYIHNDDNLTQLHPATHITSTKQSICTDISFMMFSGNGSKTLVLYPDEGPCFSSNTAKKRVQIDFDNCPPGFTLDPEHNYTRCACEQRLIEVNETNKCDIEEEVIERPDGTWIKPTWDEDGNYIGFILSRYCPFNYCNEIQSLNFLFDDGNNVSDAQCDENRTGTLCGNCTDNHSLTLNQFKCRECGNEYISLLVLFAFAGVLLIVILTGLHMTVAAGTINGLILYANIIGANSERFFSHTEVNVFTVFISWLNLDFGFDLCFFDGLDFYTYVWLQYAFPLYLWFLMGIIILSSRRSAIMMKLLGSNPIAVLATLILLSYTALLQNIIAALSFTRLEFANGTTTTVWLFNGNIAFMEGNHLILAITSLFISAFFFLPFTFFLMFGYYLLAFSNRRCFTWLNRFKPLLDAFYGPYQKEVRFWTGFMLLLRFCLYLTFALKRSRDDSTDLLAILTVFSIVISLAWLSRRGIYEKLYLDLLEASFILNIFLLTTVTYYYDTEGFSEHQDTATYVSVGIAIAEFVGIVIFHITCRILKCPCAKHLRERVLKYNANGEENLPLRNNEFVHTREAVDNHDLQVDDQI